MVHRHAAAVHDRRTKLLVLALACATVVALGMASGPVSSAHAAWTDSFCANAWLQPYGNAGDRCVMGHGYANHYSSFTVTTQTYGGCVAATGYYGEQVMSWTCTGPRSQATIYPPNPAGWYRGTIRNNNLLYAAGFRGSAYCNPAVCI